MRPLIPRIYTGFGVTLKRLKAEDLPLICEKRNDNEIRAFLDDRRKVTLPVLEFWLKKVDAYGTTFAFTAWFAGEPVAYIDLKNCNFQHGTCEDGIFLFNKTQFGANFGSRIWLTRESILRDLHIRDVFSYIRPENERSMRFFQKMGGKFINKEGSYNILMQKFQDRNRALRHAAIRLNLLEEYENSFGS